MALSEAWLKANNGKEREAVEVVADRDSMSVRISPKGKIVFQLRYRFNNKQERVDLGTYPHMSLKDARLEATRLRGLLDQNKNPKLELLVEKEKNINPITLNEVHQMWHDSYCSKNKKEHEHIKRMFENHLLPKLGDLPIDRIDITDWLKLFEELAARIPGTAKNLLSNTKQMLKWAAKRKYVQTNVLADIFPKADLNIVSKPTKRVLTDDEIKVFYECLKWSRLTQKNKLFLELCLIYACRNGELRRAEKKHFDFKRKIWTVPPSNHKTGYKNDKTLIRPILPYMEVLIKEAFELSGGKYLFSNGKDETEYLTDAASTQLPSSIIGWVKRFKNETMEHWSLHDLRRTARTNFSSFSKNRDIHEIMLGHVLPNNQEVYDLHSYVAEQTEVYEKWIEKLERLKG
ncbi:MULTISPECIES: tyrosine-type recombinase/integrase [Acinetobacter]|uniref:Integrase n=1 Tax=Acinetobacter junii TaxID=40215 RepID=A0A365PMG7_ACIJU|nr:MULTISPECIES: integrase family protein [Acinetobacter]RBA42370.1 integrase [Acinetobacter junii]RBA42940.1 integrase [Acinetobacter junii]RBA49845.1 integrase [Acinetobacter junii]WLF73435.1 integrase family protein [Acinetobacter junii]